MIRRRQINAARRAARTRSLLARAGERVRDAGLAIRERVVWNGGERLRSAADVLRWPFERVTWAFERTLVWPLGERVGGSGLPLRSGGVAAAALLAAGLGVLGLLWAAGGGGTTTAEQTHRQPAIAAVHSAPEAVAPAPALQGATPDFTSSAAGKASSDSTSAPAAEEETGKTTGSGGPVDATTTFSTGSASTSSAPAKKVPAGPAAMKVARRFAGAFVLYETGRSDSGVRTAFGETASPRLARALLRRPPRLPANVKVPKAKVVNIVPGPRHGNTHTLSVSLLRVGVTSELRINVTQDEKSGEWQVTDVLG
ncbi:MAG TPA: hypothetical protein VFJ64_03505 [Solirubrobacterales bacterium]|nr:hypothetical protein [Solirubrobacterales bacterium]